MNIANQNLLRSRGVTAFGLNGYQQIYSRYNSSFAFVSSLMSYEKSINLPTPQAVDSCWTSGNIFRIDNTNGVVVKTSFSNEKLSSLNLSSPYSLSVIQSSVPMKDDNPITDECLGCWIVYGTSLCKTDKDLSIQVEITNLISPTLVCVNHSNNGCYIIDNTIGVYSFDSNGNLDGTGSFIDDYIIGILSNSDGNLFILTETDLYKLINNNGNIELNISYNLPSYLSSYMSIGCFDIDTSTNYIYTCSGDKTDIKIVKFDSNGSHLGTFSSSEDFPHIIKVSQHPSSDTFYIITDDDKIIESSSSESSEGYSSESSTSSESSGGYSESSSTSSDQYSESSSSENYGTFRVYLDGVLKGSGNLEDVKPRGISIGLYFGLSGGSNVLDGGIDEFAYWRNISFYSESSLQDFVNSLYNSGSGRFYSGGSFSDISIDAYDTYLESYFNLNESSGNRTDSVNSYVLSQQNSIPTGFSLGTRSGKNGNAIGYVNTYGSGTTQEAGVLDLADAIPDPENSFAFSCWVMEDVNSSGSFFSFGNISFHSYTGIWRAEVTGSNFSTNLPFSPPSTGIWHHVVITGDRGTINY